MKYRSFGQTGLKVSAIGFGCWELGGNYGDYNDSHVISAIHKALDVGITCFDTAQGYGSLAHGLLTGVFNENTTFGDNDWRRRGGAFNLKLWPEEDFPKTLRVVEDLKGIASDMGTKIANLALVGARTPDEVEDNLGALDVEFDDATTKTVDDAFERHGVDTRPAVWVEDVA